MHTSVLRVIATWFINICVAAQWRTGNLGGKSTRAADTEVFLHTLLRTEKAEGEGAHFYVEQQYRRSWPGSTGGHKVAANYAPSILPCKHRRQQGFQQVLWTAPAATGSSFTQRKAPCATVTGEGPGNKRTLQQAGEQSRQSDSQEMSKPVETVSHTKAAVKRGAGVKAELPLQRDGVPAAIAALQREDGEQKTRTGDSDSWKTIGSAGERNRVSKNAGHASVAAAATMSRTELHGKPAAVAKEEEGKKAAIAQGLRVDEVEVGKESRELLATTEDEDDLMWCEGGAMSIFLFWRNDENEEELATPALERDLILPGIMRDTVLHIARGYKNIKVAERLILMERVFLKAHAEGRVHEVFCTGTGAAVVPVAVLHFEGINYDCVPRSGFPSLSRRLLSDIYDIQYGEIPHHYVQEC